MVYSLDLDITPGGVPQIVKLSQYDKTIPEIQAVLWNGPSGYTIPTGATVWVAGTKPDKTGFEYQCTYSGSTVTIDITEQMTAVAGRVPVEIIVETATGRKGSANFFLDVEPAALADDTIISDTDIPIIQQIPEILADCEDYADLAHKWATFGNDSETPSSTNNALYWAQKSQEYAVGALHWKASVTFANIPTTGMTVGDMYNITDAFTTDARFDEGAGVKCSAGTNIVWDANGKWDILISSTNAADINFDNTGTGMTATNVQNAINELNSNLPTFRYGIKTINGTPQGDQFIFIDETPTHGVIIPIGYVPATDWDTRLIFTSVAPSERKIKFRIQGNTIQGYTIRYIYA